MNSFEGLAYGFQVCFAAQNLLAVGLGVVIGTVIGVLPGIGPVGAMAIPLPITLTLTPTAALIMLAGIYYGAMYGGSTTSILVNVPGEAASVVTAREGYQMARNGRAGPALAVAAVGSFIAGTFGVVILMLFAPSLANIALKFAPPEYFAIALLGLLALSRISGGSFWQSLAVLGVGMMIASVGMDPITSIPRFDFGILDLLQGINIMPVIMGLYGVAEVLCVAEQAGGLPHIHSVRFRDLFPNRREWGRAFPAILRGTGVGLALGLVPGPSSIISTFFSYKIEHSISKRKKEWGRGAIEGVAGPESANNAASSTTMIPILSLGVPFTAPAAMLLAGLLLQGIQPGPLLMIEHPEVFWGVIASMYLGNAALLLLNFPLVGMWVSLLRIPQSILLGLILLFTFLGSYSVNNSFFDVLVLVIFGVLGYLARKIRFNIAPLVVAMILGPMLENMLRTSLYMSKGDWLIFFKRPISAGLLIAMAVILVGPSLWSMLSRRKKQLRADSSISVAEGRI
jgi:putative tricarboxylic transport membrane protein